MMSGTKVSRPTQELLELLLLQRMLVICRLPVGLSIPGENLCFLDPDADELLASCAPSRCAAGTHMSFPILSGRTFGPITHDDQEHRLGLYW